MTFEAACARVDALSALVGAALADLAQDGDAWPALQKQLATESWPEIDWARCDAAQKANLAARIGSLQRLIADFASEASRWDDRQQSAMTALRQQRRILDKYSR